MQTFINQLNDLYMYEQSVSHPSPSPHSNFTSCPPAAGQTIPYERDFDPCKGPDGQAVLAPYAPSPGAMPARCILRRTCSKRCLSVLHASVPTHITNVALHLFPNPSSSPSPLRSLYNFYVFAEYPSFPPVENPSPLTPTVGVRKREVAVGHEGFAAYLIRLG